MGITKNSTGNRILEEDIFEKAIGCNYTIAIAGNPNVRQINYF